MRFSALSRNLHIAYIEEPKDDAFATLLAFEQASGMRNAQRIQESIRKGKVKVLFNSNPEEFTNDSAILDVKSKMQRIPNDFVWIFAGGEPPTAFLKKIGIRCGAQDLTNSAGQEAKEAKAAREAALALR